jgi:hypothetical protein
MLTVGTKIKFTVYGQAEQTGTIVGIVNTTQAARFSDIANQYLAIQKFRQTNPDENPTLTALSSTKFYLIDVLVAGQSTPNTVAVGEDWISSLTVLTLVADLLLKVKDVPAAEVQAILTLLQQNNYNAEVIVT